MSTVLSDGLWLVRLEVTDSAGFTGVDEHPLWVQADFKPGRYQVAFQDFTMALPTGPVSVVRSYDTLDAGQVGDFGPGWTLQLLDVRVASNGALGDGGWGAQTCGSGWLYTPLCHVSAKPHVVAVTWPDGSTEVFDLTPLPTTTFFP